jgi:hypothetical protein
LTVFMVVEYKYIKIKSVINDSITFNFMIC